MVTTFCTSQELYTYATGSSVTVGTSTQPTEAALDLIRLRVYSIIYSFIQTNVDINNVAKGMELDLGKRLVDNLTHDTYYYLEITPDQKELLLSTFGDIYAPFTIEPNANG